MGRQMCEGEFRSLQEIYAVSPAFVPKPFAWGKYQQQEPETYFLLTEFRLIREQVRQALQTPTTHAKIDQAVDQLDDSWSALFSRHLRHIMELAQPILKWPEFDVICRLTLDKVVPRLLLLLQENGRVLKPSLIHGDCWDGNTAIDAKTGEAFVFDACSFYGHNEYDVGN